MTRDQIRETKARREHRRFPHPIDHYLATDAELRSNGFPLPDDAGSLPEGYVETSSTPAGLTPRRLVACDCEMVRCASGLALARVTLVGEKGEVLLDEYVRPDEPVLDHNTRWSGITEKEIAAATMGLDGARERVLELVHKDTGKEKGRDRTTVYHTSASRRLRTRANDLT